MRKVYGLLAVQLIMTTVIAAALLLTPGVKELVQVNMIGGPTGLHTRNLYR